MLQRMHRITTLVFGLLLALVWAESAQAALTVQLVWVATTGSGIPGGDRIRAEPGDRLTLDIFIIVDEAGVLSYSISVVFDADLGDELDLVETEEFDHVATLPCDPFPECFEEFGPEMTNENEGIEAENESDDMNPGSAEGFEADAVGAEGPSDITIRIGRIIFDVTENVLADGADIEASLFADSDGYLDNNLDAVLPEDLPHPDFTPGFAPEPNGGLLAAAAMTTITWLHRRRQSARV